MELCDASVKLVDMLGQDADGHILNLDYYAREVWLRIRAAEERFLAAVEAVR